MIRIPLLILAAGALAAGDAEPPKHPGGGDGPQGGRPNPRAIFDRMDANHDGKVTQEEFLAFKPGAEGRPPGPPPGHGDGGGEGRPPGPPPGEGGEGPLEAKLFEKLDADKDGKISREEFAKLRELMRELRENRPGGPGGQGRPSREEVFKRLDQDGDGAMTFEEFEAGRPKPPGDKPGHPPGKPGDGGGDR